MSRPVETYEADCERFGNIQHLGWLVGNGRPLLAAHNGSNWWQRLLVELAEIEFPEWQDTLVEISKKPRSAAMIAE